MKNRISDLRIGLEWAKALSFTTRQTPVMKYHRRLMNAIMYDKCHIAKAVNAKIISLDERKVIKNFIKGSRINLLLIHII